MARGPFSMANRDIPLDPLIERTRKGTVGEGAVAADKAEGDAADKKPGEFAASGLGPTRDLGPMETHSSGASCLTLTKTQRHCGRPPWRHREMHCCQPPRRLSVKKTLEHETLKTLCPTLDLLQDVQEGHMSSFSMTLETQVTLEALWTLVEQLRHGGLEELIHGGLKELKD